MNSAVQDEPQDLIHFPAKPRADWLERSAEVLRFMEVDPRLTDVAEILSFLLVDRVRAEAAQQRCEWLERQVFDLRTDLTAAVAQVEMLEDLHGREIRGRHLAMMAPDWPAVRETEQRWDVPFRRLSDGTILVPAGPDDDPFEAEPKLIFVKRAETAGPRVAEQHEGHQCVWPCIVHDPEAFVANALGQTPAGRALGVRKEA